MSGPPPDPQDAAREAARFRALFEATADMVWRSDAYGRTIDLGRWPEITGQARDDGLGYGWRATVHPDDLRAAEAGYRAALRGRQPYAVVFRLRVADGSYRRFRLEAVPILGADGRVAEWVGITRDVEARLAAEERLRSGQARYRSLVEATAQIVWRTTAEGGEIDGHEAWSAFTGVPVTPASDPAEWFIPVHPDDRAGLTAAWRDGFAAGRTYEHPYRLRAADGTWRAMVVRAVPVRDPDGRIVEWVGTHTDVTEREAARVALERERALLAESQRIGRLGSWAWDLAAGETWVSDEVYRIFGVRPDEVSALGANAVAAFDALLVPEDRVAIGAKRAAIVAGRVPASSDRWRAVRPDGRALVIEAQSEWRYDADGRPVYASGTVQDVTDQAAADEALRASEERFRLAARATHDVLYEWDVAGGPVWVSEQMRATFRLPPGTTTDHAWWRASVHPDDAPRVLASLEGTLAGSDEVATIEYRLRRGDGTWATVSDRTYLVRDAAGRPCRMIGALLDVSEQRELEAQLRQAQKMEAVGQLAGGIAHDFNNLLSVILGTAELSRGAAPPGSVLAADLDEISRAARRGAQLTRQLLAFSRRQVLRPRLLDVVAVVRGAEPLLRRLLPDTVTLDLSLPDAPHVVHADPGQLEQVLMNLVVNARDAITAVPGRTFGVVQVAVEAVRLDSAEAAAAAGAGPEGTGVRAGAYVRLTVRDDGVGMDAETRARVFEPFFTTKEPGRGTGLGLSTAFGIAVQSGGTMRVESAPGHGALFALLLPAAGDAAPAAESAVGPDAPRAVGETVLLVEDETVVRRTARRVLERHGYRVVEARHGVDALLLWDECGGAVDVVLSDLRMPEMGGCEVVRRLRARCPTLPAVLMSGYVQDPPAGEAAANPRVWTLDKPFTPAQLLDAVRSALDGRGEGE